MSKKQAVVELEELAQSLEQIAGPQPQDAPGCAPAKEYPIITNPDGTRYQNQQCTIHPGSAGWYRKFWLTGWASQYPSGQCEQCKKEEALQREADAAISRDEVASRVRQLLPEYEGEVVKQSALDLDAELERHRAEVAPFLESEVRSRLWQQLELQVTKELRD
jgi:hypothetical protein